MENQEQVDQEIELKKLSQLANDYANSVKSGAAPVYGNNVKVFKGRKKIYTNYLCASQVNDNVYGYQVLNESNIAKAVNEAMAIHKDNALEIKALLNYYKGEQDIVYRNKEIRPDVNNRIVINYANTFTRDIIGYTFGKPMKYIARRTDEDEEGLEQNDDIKKEVRLLNDYSELTGKEASDQEKAVDCSIYGISHRGIFAKKNAEEDDDAPYYYLNLDSESTFVAYSSQLNREPVFAGTYTRSYGDENNDNVLLTVYTVDDIYVFNIPFSSGRGYDTETFFTVEKDYIIQHTKNPLKMIPIVECENNQFRMGHWEAAITLMDAINKAASDSVNDVEQFVNSILVAVNAEFTQEAMENVKVNHYAEISNPQGLNADLKYIQGQLDGGSVEQLRQYLEDCLRAVVGIPDRKTRGGGGGDTGDAVKLRDGWADMEVVARITETFNKESEKKELKIILKILKDLQKIKKTSMINVDVKYPRNKTDNLNSKVTAMSTMLSTQVMAPEDVLDIVDITSDNAEVIARGEKYWKQKKEENFEEQQRQLAMQGVNNGVTQEGGNENARTNTKSNRNSGSKRPSDKQPTNNKSSNNS